MKFIEIEKDRMIASKNEKVTCWYLIQRGSVLQKTDLSEVLLGTNSIIGFLEKDAYLCDYIACEDTTLIALHCENLEEIKKTLAGQEKIRNIFLKAAVTQRQQLLLLYANLFKRTNDFRALVETLYEDYKAMCEKYKIETQRFFKMETFLPLAMQHKAEMWEVNNSASIASKYMQDYIRLMEKDDSMTVGVIMETAAQMRRFILGIYEMENFLSYNKEILIWENENNLFDLFFDLAVEMYEKKYAIGPVTEKIEKIIEAADALQIYNKRFIARRKKEFDEYDYKGDSILGFSVDTADRRATKEIDIVNEDCMSQILTYAGYGDEEIDEISGLIKDFYENHDIYSSDSKVAGIRKKITALFYEIYLKVFMRAVDKESSLTPVLKMFLNFGFMDVSLVGEERARELYDLCAHLDICNSRRVYTIYEWLKQIYKGKKLTSKNDFDINYEDTLSTQLREKKITEDEFDKKLHNKKLRVEFELNNMFVTLNKLTYGRITTFCPILSSNDLINSVDKMLVTADKLETAMNEIRKIDYSIFFREVTFSDPAYGITSDRIMKEVLPDIILMPNAGSNSMMWQETSSIKSDTPGRFAFPIFTYSDLNDLVLVAMGRFRWEMCRKVEGMRWNDLREKSLTAEYFSYLQFYRKNTSLSAEAKEKIKSALSHSKNNFREVFVRDYINWIRFESKGSYRLNKVTRDILTRHCQFPKAIRDEQRNNLFYQSSIMRLEKELSKKQLHYTTVINKYDKAGGEYMKELKDTLLFYEM